MIKMSKRTPFSIYRLRAGYVDMNDLAEATGIRVGTLFNYEHGRTKPGKEYASKIAGAFGQDVGTVFPDGTSSPGQNWVRGLHKMDQITEDGVPASSDLELISVRAEVLNMPSREQEPYDAATERDLQESFYEALRHVRKDWRIAVYVLHVDEILNGEPIGVTQEEIVAVIKKGRHTMKEYERKGIRKLQALHEDKFNGLLQE
jgi:transcriptional regulator with XRE-family HTH domain